MKYFYRTSFFLIFSLVFSYEPTTLTGMVVDEENNPVNKVYILTKSDQLYSDDDGVIVLSILIEQISLTYSVLKDADSSEIIKFIFIS